MKREGSLILKLDEVRPGRGVPAARREKPPVKLPDSQPPSLPRKKPDVTYKVTNIVTKSKVSELGKMLFFILVVVIPTTLATAYNIFIASPQYVSEFRFSVRPSIAAGAPTNGQAEAMLMMSNSYIVSDYVVSRDAMEALDKKLDLRTLFSDPAIDYWSRLKRDAAPEEFVKYWQSHVKTSYDLSTGINTVEVIAFTPQDAQKMAIQLKMLCENLVNKISEDARKGQMEFAHDELQRAEDRLVAARTKEADLRAQQKTIDARKEGEGKIQLGMKMRSDLAGLRAQYNTLQQYMDEGSPKLTVLKAEIASTQQQLDALTKEIGSSGSSGQAADGTMDDAQLISQFDQLQTELDISTKLYGSALNNYELARAQASNTQIYLATYVQPSEPERATYPKIFVDGVLIFLSACGIWIILTLIYYSIRDHV